MKFPLPNALRNMTRLAQAGNLPDTAAILQRLLEGMKLPQMPVDLPRADGFMFNNQPPRGFSETGKNADATTDASGFLTKTFSNANGTRRYKLYIPTGHAGT